MINVVLNAQSSGSRVEKLGSRGNGYLFSYRLPERQGCVQPHANPKQLYNRPVSGRPHPSTSLFKALWRPLPFPYTPAIMVAYVPPMKSYHPAIILYY